MAFCLFKAYVDPFWPSVTVLLPPAGLQHNLLKH